MVSPKEGCENFVEDQSKVEAVCRANAHILVHTLLSKWSRALVFYETHGNISEFPLELC